MIETAAPSQTSTPASGPALPCPPVHLLVFDLDGTLIDSSADLCRSVNAALLHVGRSELPASQIASFIGHGAAMLMHRALSASPPRDGYTDADTHAVFDRGFQHFLHHYHLHKLDTTRPYPGVLEALHALRARHPELPMAVLTNKPVRPSREICRALGLLPYFFAVYGGDSFAKKPNPEGLRAIMDEANVNFGQRRSQHGPIAPETAVMIGDSDVDVQTARNCGVRSLGCGYGLAPSALAASAPDLWSAHPGDWARVLQL